MTTCSNALIDTLRQEIAMNHDAISFARFMELALYHPTLGYYNSDKFTLGTSGDFTTAPEISPLFAKCFARQCLPLFDQTGSSHLLEIGAGTGKFAHDLLRELDRNKASPTYYFIYEPNLALRKKQQAFLKSACDDYYHLIVWLDTLPTHFRGVIIANEVLDALPVHCFRIEGHTTKERCVTWDHDQFTWKTTDPSTNELTEKVAKIREFYGLSEGYESEINLQLSPFIKAVTNSLHQGAILFADYGYGQQEYYHPQRKKGTLTCFYQHRRHDNPLILPGQQDITAHVDFTLVAENAAENECSLLGYTTQAAFLLANGLLEFAAQDEKNLSHEEVFSLHQTIKTLTLPSEMGEIIKIMGLGKNLTRPLAGFSLQDRRRDL